MDLMTCCADYLDRARQFVPLTYQHKRRMARGLLKYFGPAARVESIGRAEIEAYLDTQLGAGRTASAVNEDRKHIAAFWAWMRDREIVDENPVLKIAKYPALRRSIYTPTEEEMRRVSAVAAGQNLAILNAFIFTAARAVEVYRLKWGDDVDLVGKRIRLGTKKTNDGSIRYDWIRMAGMLHASLDWHWRHRRWPKRPEVFLAAGRDGNPRPVERWERTCLYRLCDKAGVRRFGIHSIRRYTASRLAAMPGVSLKDIQDILRHGSIKNTSLYIKNIGASVAGDALDRL